MIKRNIYSPVGHETIERENELIRKGLLNVLEHNIPIPMVLISSEETLSQQADLQTAKLKYYNSKNDEK